MRREKGAVVPGGQTSAPETPKASGAGEYAVRPATRKGCSHGKTFNEPCLDCEAITLRWSIAYHRERLESGTARMAQIAPSLQPST